MDPLLSLIRDLYAQLTAVQKENAELRAAVAAAAGAQPGDIREAS